MDKSESYDNETYSKDAHLDMDISHSDENHTGQINIKGNEDIDYKNKENGGSLEMDHSLDWSYINTVNIKPIYVHTCEGQCDKFCKSLKGDSVGCVK